MKICIIVLIKILKLYLLCKNAVYDLIRKGLLTALKLGRIKVTKPTLLEFLKEYSGKDLSDLENIKELTFQNEASIY
ncbi:transcriptional regulator [Clostridium magnum]|uniref:transcriptional regulator n=1 Tax=Clostridium magnum TaxID=33954 RepID=UPI0009348C38|nr:transcriptional regulator [Clostridium magnum]